MDSFFFYEDPMFMFDIETLGIESTTVVLSAGIIFFNPEKDKDISYNELVGRGLFVKFDAQEQIKEYGRTVSKSTLEWWEKQGKWQKDNALIPSDNDVSVNKGFNRIHSYIDKNMKQNNMTWDNTIIWARGSLDQMAIDSLANKAVIQPIAYFNKWRDVRTAVDLLTGSNNGYCEVDNLNMSDVYKHHPVHDCAYDILMLLRGKTVN